MFEPEPASGRNSFNESPLFQVFSACARELRSFLTRRLGCVETAADLVQDTYIRLATRQESETHSNPRALVFRIAANLATDHTRHRRARERVDAGCLDFPGPASAVPQPDAMVLARQEHDLLKRAIAELPEKRRTVFLLRTSQELSYGQIADRLGISVSAVEKHMSKAVRHCRTRMERYRDEHRG
jgi:RNA polymerase sigma factor (sigma-70 family)